MSEDLRRTIEAEITSKTLRECERIVSAALALEEPEGVRVIDLASQGKRGGLCRGSGHNTAQAFGLPGIAVFVCVGEIVHEVVAKLPAESLEFVMLANPTPLFVAKVAPVAAHEAAHAIVATRDAGAFDAGYVRSIATNYTGPIDNTAHHARWSAACHMIYRRCRRIAPGVDWGGSLAREHRFYGLPREPIAEIVEGIDPAANIREALADPVIRGRLEAIAPHTVATSAAA